MTYWDNSDALLPSGERMNPMQPEDHFCFWPDGEQSAIIVERLHADTKKPSIWVFTGAGATDPNGTWGLGTIHQVHHDQTGRNQGRFKVIGIRNFDSGSIYGVVPDKKLPHHVFK